MKEEPVAGRTSAFTDPTNFTESVALLESLSLAPGQKCAIIAGSNKAEQGTINRIEIYQNSLLVSVLIDNIRRPYPVSIIGIDLFIGNDSFEQAMDAARDRV
jgi:ribosomal protein S4E